MSTCHRHGRPESGRTGTSGLGVLRSGKGFSLAELLIVIAIIGILAAMAGYSWQRYISNSNLRSAARDIATDFALAKENAIKESRNYTITFNVGANTYTMAPTGSAKSPSAVASDIQLTQAAFGAGTVITFQSRGTASAGNVVLTNGRGSTARIVVNITGKNHVEYTMQ